MKNFYTSAYLTFFLISSTINTSASNLQQIEPATCNTPAAINMASAKLFGDGTPQSCTQKALQDLITAGGKIMCNCGSSAFTLKLTSTLIIPVKEVIIDGANLLIISGENNVRIFDKLPAANQNQGTLFALQNMDLKNGKAVLKEDERGGSAIMGRAFGSLIIHNVNFENNNASLEHPDDCGAIHTILYKEASFYNCTFKNNKGANGGAIGTIGSATTIINCAFDNNKATGKGGIPPGKGGNGGAVYVDGVDQNGVTNTFKMCGNSFTNNSAGYQAGAVNVIFYANKNSVATVEQCVFKNNSCAIDKGGAYYHMNGPLNLQSSTFENNSSPTQGGAIWCSNTKLNISNSTLVTNRAVSADNKGGLGGAICIDGSGSEKAATISNCTFAENRSGNFASVIFNGGSTTLNNNIFYNNKIGKSFQSNPYGGGILNKTSSLTVNTANLQFPSTYDTEFETARTDDWITNNGNGKILITDPKIAVLAYNGGFTQTMALASNSPAIDKGSNCATKDQRGFERTGKCDLGAYEFEGKPAALETTFAANEIAVLYPNPLKMGDAIHASLSDSNLPCDVKIYNTLGNLVHNQKLENLGENIETANLSQGIYVVVMSGNMQVKKVVLTVK